MLMVLAASSMITEVKRTRAVSTSRNAKKHAMTIIAMKPNGQEGSLNMTNFMYFL